MKLAIRVWLYVVVSGVLAVLRIGGLKHEAFQAVAHLWVGGLLTAWGLVKFSGLFPFVMDGMTVDAPRWWKFIGFITGWLAVFLSVVELGCFIVSKVSAK